MYSNLPLRYALLRYALPVGYALFLFVQNAYLSSRLLQKYFTKQLLYYCKKYLNLNNFNRTARTGERVRWWSNWSRDPRFGSRSRTPGATARCASMTQQGAMTSPPSGSASSHRRPSISSTVSLLILMKVCLLNNTLLEVILKTILVRLKIYMKFCSKLDNKFVFNL